jgi:hypothetical protein
MPGVLQAGSICRWALQVSKGPLMAYGSSMGLQMGVGVVLGPPLAGEGPSL